MLCVLIGVAEHLSNEVYRIALIVPRHRPALVAVLTKNVAMLAAVVATTGRNGEHLDLDLLFGIWAALSLGGVLAVAALFRTTARPGSAQGWRRPDLTLSEQYRSSRTHFTIGLVALAAVQADRLIAGGLLSLEQSGVYFRHVFLASFAYQAFSVSSFNRISPRVYRHAHANEPSAARSAIQRELRTLVPAALLLALAVWSFDPAWLGTGPALRSIQPHYLAILLLGFLLRALADYNALLLNAVYREREIFIAQSIALALSVGVNLVLTAQFGIAGTVSALVLGAGIYLATSGVCVRRLPAFKAA
jgi:O-antigen/teichoic acid export membrane protein